VRQGGADNGRGACAVEGAEGGAALVGAGVVGRDGWLRGDRGGEEGEELTALRPVARDDDDLRAEAVAPPVPLFGRSNQGGRVPQLLAAPRARRDEPRRGAAELRRDANVRAAGAVERRADRGCSLLAARQVDMPHERVRAQRRRLLDAAVERHRDDIASDERRQDEEEGRA